MGLGIWTQVLTFIQQMLLPTEPSLQPGNNLLVLSLPQVHRVTNVSDIQKKKITVISHSPFFIVFHATNNPAIRRIVLYFTPIAPKGGILIFIWARSESFYAHTDWRLIFPDNDVDMSLEYPYAQHLLFQTCSSLIIAIGKLPKIKFYGGF